MTIKHYRGEEFIRNIQPVSAVLQRTLMGPFIIKMELADVSDIYVRDILKIEDTEPSTFIVRTIESRQLTAEHISYKLRNYAVIDKYLNDPPTYDDQISFADITVSDVLEFLRPLLEDIGFSVVNNSNNTERRDISFSGDNLLSAIQKVAETFKVEFVPHDTYIEFVDQAGHDTGIPVNGGINTEIIQKKINKNWIVTRIYPSGSGENLPDGYYYTALKPTDFDVETKTHTGNLYIDNPEAIEKYGVIERVVEFPDIKIQSRRGTVKGTGTDYFEEYDKSYPYIYDDELADIDEEKAESATLFLVDGLNAAELRIMKVSKDDKKIWYSTTLKDGSELSWTPSVGASYTLVGYITQEEIDDAVQKLRSAAQKYLEEHSEPQVEYNIDTTYWRNAPAINPGDIMHLRDDTQGIKTDVRVISFTKDLITGAYTRLKLSNHLEKIPYTILKEQMRQADELKRIKLSLVKNAQTAREALERHNLLVRNNFYGSENEYALIGAPNRNYALKGVTITPDDGTPGKVSWTGGDFQIVFDNDVYQIGAGSVQLSSGVYWIYIQLKQGDYANSSGYNKLVFSVDKKESSGDLLYYPLGMAEFDGTRTKVGTSYGFTLIDGAYIKTGTIDADKIASRTITADKIASRTITANEIASKTITADKLNVTKLSSISANIGTVTAGVLKSADGLLKIDLTNKRITASVLTFSIDKSLGIIGKVNSTSKWGGAFMGQWYAKVSGWNSSWADPPTFNYPFLFPTYLWFFADRFGGWLFHFWWYIPNSKLKKSHITVRIDAHDDECAVLIKNVSTSSTSTLLNLPGYNYVNYYEASATLSSSDDYILLAKVHNSTGPMYLWFGFNLY